MCCYIMASTRQELLRDAWLGGRTGYLSPLSEARAWALREVWREDDKADHGMCAFIARKVTKVGGGNPERNAVRKFFEQMDEDPEWFPGKPTQERHGPASVR